MKCIICKKTIELDDQVFWLSEMICHGSGDFDYKLTIDSSQVAKTMHVSCLDNPTEVKETSNTETYEYLEEALVVQRSDALSLFDL